MKGFIKAVCLTAVTAISAAALSGCKVAATPERIFKSASGVALPVCDAVTTVDTTGFMGDGEKMFIFSYGDEEKPELEEKFSVAENWLPLPLTDDLAHLLYEHFDCGIPRIDNGYYLFYDEQNKAYTLPPDYEETSYSYDFVFCAYDRQSTTVYYFEQHT